MNRRPRWGSTALLGALGVLLALGMPSAHGQLLISEFMASNRQTLADDFGQAEDWIEIHNGSPGTVALLDWALTDDPEDLRKWRFPAFDLAPGGYLVVFASDRDRRDPTAPLHTNFKLDADGEFLALVDPAGAIVSQFAPVFPSQVADVSFGFGQELRFTTNLTDGAFGRVMVPTSWRWGPMPATSPRRRPAPRTVPPARCPAPSSKTPGMGRSSLARRRTWWSRRECCRCSLPWPTPSFSITA